jgi:hypothetical protein
MTSLEGAQKFREYVSDKTPPDQLAFSLFSGFEVEITEVDFQETAFYKMMKLNNFALLVCDDFIAGGDEIAFDGSLVDVEYPPDDEHRMFFDRLLNLPE